MKVKNILLFLCPLIISCSEQVGENRYIKNRSQKSGSLHWLCKSCKKGKQAE